MNRWGFPPLVTGLRLSYRSVTNPVSSTEEDKLDHSSAVSVDHSSSVSVCQLSIAFSI